MTGTRFMVYCYLVYFQKQEKAMSEKIDRNLSLQLIRVTESGALSTALVMGRGEIGQISQGAAQAMERTLQAVEVDGTIAIGVGQKGETNHLYVGQKVGDGSDPAMDVAVRPIDGVRLLANGQPHAISIIALAEPNTLYRN